MERINVGETRNHSKRPRPEHRQRPRLWLTGPAKAWLAALAGIASIDGLIWIAIPGFAANSAYSLALDLAPQSWWGWAMALAGGAAWASVRFDGRWWAIECGRFAFAMYGVVSFVVGLSILSLTLTSSVSALSGTTKWWGLSLACFVGLAGPTITATRRTTLREWLGL